MMPTERGGWGVSALWIIFMKMFVYMIKNPAFTDYQNKL
jgi:hypothetical protein